MQVITLHDSETEEIIGMVSPVQKVDFDKFYDEVFKLWTLFNDNGLAEDYTIEDYVDFHNDNSELSIDWVLVDYIQL